MIEIKIRPIIFEDQINFTLYGGDSVNVHASQHILTKQFLCTKGKGLSQFSNNIYVLSNKFVLTK